MKILVTGGAGFIGGNFVHHMVNKYPDYEIVNLDLLTYAGNLETLKPVEDKPNYKFVKGDIADREFIMDLFEKEKFDIVVCNAFQIFQRQIKGIFSFISFFTEKVKKDTKIVSVFQTGLTACPRFDTHKIILAERGKAFYQFVYFIDILNITFDIVIFFLHNKYCTAKYLSCQ